MAIRLADEPPETGQPPETMQPNGALSAGAHEIFLDVGLNKGTEALAGRETTVGERHSHTTEERMTTINSAMVAASGQHVPAQATVQAFGTFNRPQVDLGGGGWLQRVRAGPSKMSVPSEEELKKSKMLHAVWKPAEQKALLATLVTDWEAVNEQPWTPEVQAMRELALDPARVSCDESIRTWTKAEEAALLAYTRGELELPHPPNFVKEIMISEHRALLEDFHEAHLNFTLTANVPPSVRLPRNAPHVAILQEFFTANTDENGRGRVMMRRFLQDVKRFIFDGNHTLSFIFFTRNELRSSGTRKLCVFNEPPS